MVRLMIREHASRSRRESILGCSLIYICIYIFLYIILLLSLVYACMTAERNKVGKQAVDLLTRHGGKPSELARIEERGALFGNAADAHAKSEQRRATEKATKDAKVAEVASKADSAKGVMGDAMNALHIRGQKINDLGDKTQELEENAKQYGSLASQLKDKVKAKKWYQL